MTTRKTNLGDAAELRKQAEAKAAQVPEDLAALSPAEIRRTLHQLRVHQIELEMQNEELRTAQADLVAARARYFELYDLAPVGYCTVSEPGLILEANLTATTLLGVARGALVTQPLTRFIFKEDQDIYYRHHTQLCEAGAAQACELRMVQNDGTTFRARLEVTAAQDAAGAPVCRITLSDITERTQAEQALRESEVRYRELFDNISSGVAIYEVTNNGNDFIFKDFNRAGERLDGDRKENVIGKSIYHVRPGINAYGLLEVFKRVWATGIPEHYPAKFYQDEHVQGWYDNFVYRLPSGEIVAVYDDITERKKAEEELKKQMEELVSWHHVTLGREGRVLELKDEVNELLAKLGQPPRYENLGV